MKQVTQPDYRQITDCTESYYARLGDSPLGMGWPNTADAIRRYDIMLDVIRPTTTAPIRLLDFGCGTGHLYEHLQRTGRDDIVYCGIDLSPRFISVCREKHPGVWFECRDALQESDSLPDFDYAVINGVFTSKCSMSFDAMFGFFRRTTRALFERCRCGIAFNAMSKQVDWERDDLFHLPLDRMAAFLCAELSRHFVIRNDYGLYEFTTYVYRECGA